MQERGPAAYVAEFVGTFALVFSITASVVLFAPAATTTVPGVPAPFQDFAVIGLVHTLALFFLIQSFALISGAHFNPAITLGLTAIRQLRIVDAGIYIVMQLAGGTLGALFTKALMTGVNPGVHYGAPGLQLSRIPNSRHYETSLTLVGSIPSIPLIVSVGPLLVNCTRWTVPLCVLPDASE